MIRLGVKVKDDASPALLAMRGDIDRPEALLLPASRYGATLLKRYYRRLDVEKPNRLGGTRQRWWHKVASSVNNPVLRTGKEAAIEITQPGIALKIVGGRVRPRTAKALAIPVHRDSYGIWARDWEQRYPDRPLFPVRTRRSLVLAEADGEGVRVLYVLKKSQEIPVDPDALPSAKDFETPLLDYARKRLATLVRRASKR